MNLKNKSGNIAYIDSIEAYKKAAVENYSLVITDIPELAYFLRNKNVFNIDSLISKDETFILGDLSLQIADIVDKQVTEILNFKNLKYLNGLKLAGPIGVMISSLLYRSLIFTRFFNEINVKNIDLYINEKWSHSSDSFFEVKRFSSPFSKLCELGFLNQLIKYQVIECKSEIIDEKVDGSLNNIFIKSLMYPLDVVAGQIIDKSKILNLVIFKNYIPIIGSPDGIIRESLPWLNLLGYNYKIFPKVLPGVMKEYVSLNKNTTDTQNMDHDLNILNILKYKLNGFFSDNELVVISNILNKFILGNLNNLPKWIQAVRQYSEKIFNLKSNNKVILASALSSPICKIFHNIVKENNYNIILFEHGISKGLTKLSFKRSHVSEVNNTDYFVSFSNVVSKLFKNINNNLLNDYITAAPVHNKRVLYNRIQRFIWRNKLNIKNNEIALIHVSPFPYSGNKRLGYGSPKETDIFEIENKFLFKYDNLPLKTFYKKYPANRFPNTFRGEELYTTYKNINFVGDLDYRYLRSPFDIIVTGTFTSTLSWCLSANKPLIFFNSEVICPAADQELLKSIKKSVFYIDIDNSNWQNKLLNYLKLPYNDLLDKWENMEEHRVSFMQNYIFCDTKKPGYKSAKFIKKIIKSNREELKYS